MRQGKANPKPCWMAVALPFDLPGRSRGVVGPPGQINPCRVMPVRAGYALRGVWLKLSLSLCASSGGDYPKLAQRERLSVDVQTSSPGWFRG